MNTIAKTSIWSASILIFLSMMYFIFFLNHTSINELGIQYDQINGEITIQNKPGWYVTSPLTQVAYIYQLYL